MNSHYGIYGGQYIPEALMSVLLDLETAYLEAKADPAFQAELDDLLAAVTLVEKTEETGGGKTICFTGRMPEKRSFYENLACDAGYEPVGDAGATLFLLVADDPGGNSSKLRNARKYGTRIISLDEFLTEISAREAAGTTTETPVQGELF